MDAMIKMKPCKYGLHFLFVVFFVLLVVTSHNVHSAEVVNQYGKSLLEFNSPNEAKEWRVVNDGVMGGLSDSQMIITQRSTAIFQGNISLKNNGGFASVRTFPRAYELSGYSGLTIRIMGDGKKYQVRLRTDDNFDGISYKESFETTLNTWINVTLHFKTFVPSFHGRLVADAPSLNPNKIRQIGFLIADEQAGPFKLEIGWIRAHKEFTKD